MGEEEEAVGFLPHDYFSSSGERLCRRDANHNTVYVGEEEEEGRKEK